MSPLLQTLLRARRRAVRLRQRHDAVRVLQVGLQGFLVGGLQHVVQVLCFPAKVTVESPVTPRENTTSCYCEGSRSFAERCTRAYRTLSKTGPVS